MERYLALGIGGLALLVGMWNGWSTSRLSSRLDALERRVEAAPAAPTPAPRRRAKANPAGADMLRNLAQEAEIDLDEVEPGDPEARQRLADAVRDRVAERQARMRTALVEAVEAFATEEGLDAQTTGRVLGALEARSDAFHNVRLDMREGNLTREEARDSLVAARQESDEALRDLLGDERAMLLEDRIGGMRGRARPASEQE